MKFRVCVQAPLLQSSSTIATLWTVATRFLRPWDFPGKNAGVGCHFLLQRIFPIQGSSPRLLCLLHCRKVLYPLSHQGSPQNLCDELNKYWLGRKNREDRAPLEPLAESSQAGLDTAPSQLPITAGHGSIPPERQILQQGPPTLRTQHSSAGLSKQNRNPNYSD